MTFHGNTLSFRLFFLGIADNTNKGRCHDLRQRTSAVMRTVMMLLESYRDQTRREGPDTHIVPRVYAHEELVAE